MNLENLPTFTPGLDQLKSDLEKLCQISSISRYAPEDIIELLSDGEDVAWLIEQLVQDNANLNRDQFSSLLTSIRALVAPAPAETATAEPEEPPLIESPGFGDAGNQMADLSQQDFSLLLPELEKLAGTKLPSGLDLKQLQKLMAGPQGKLMSDFAAWCQEQGIDATTLTDQSLLQQLTEQWQQTPRATLGGKTPAEFTQNDPSLLGLKKVETFRREQPRIGRNDPCPCGSGKKYKKCCGRES